MKTMLAALAVASALSTSAMAQIHIFAPIPRLRVEVGPPPPSPGPAYVLEPGHWQWDGAQYQWVGRQWVPRVGAGIYVPAHWSRGPVPHWVPAHWR